MQKQLKTSQRIVIPLKYARNVLLGLLLVISCVFSQTVNAQDLQVTGQVTDQAMEPLPGVSVIIQGTTVGTVTDVDGRFSLTVPSGSTLVFSFVGMQTMQIPVTDQTELSVVLTEELTALDEIVVVGYGTQSRRTITTSISQISSEDIDAVGVSSISSAIQGKASGVRVYHSDGGMPGSDATIRIRGGSSINRSNAPLVLIDGLERPLSDININDVESIEILKDASSTAIYGARASNGVILVSTKRGREGIAEINFEATGGVASPWKYMDLIGAEDYLRLGREALSRAPQRNNLWARGRGLGVGNDSDSPWTPRYLQGGESIPEGWKSMTDPVDPSQTIIYQESDYQRLTMGDAFEQNYHLSAAGGTESILYAAGVGYTNNEGTAIGTNYDRFSARVNVDFKLRDNLTLQTNFDHTSANTNTLPSQYHIFSRTLFMNPVARVYMDDGSYAPGLNAAWSNPLFYNDVHDIDVRTNRTQFGAGLSWNIAEGLDLSVKGDYFLRTTDREQFQKANFYTTARNSQFNFTKNNRLQFDSYMTYNRAFAEDHNFTLMAGGSYLNFEGFTVRARAFGAATDLIQTMNAAPEKADAHSFRQDEVLLGLFSRLTYDYSEKYMAAISLRRDASSRFAAENRVGYFPGASVGWMISEEPFMDFQAINSLKLRSSWGQTGNNSVGRYDAWGLYTVGRNYEFQAGTFPSAMPNFALGWETTTQVDVGFDLTMFDYRFTFLADYYVKTTDHLIFQTPLPNTSGFTNILRNIGSVKYWGWDFEADYRVIDNTDFTWNLGANVSFNWNEVIDLPDNGMPQHRIGGIYNPETGVGVGGIAIGEPLGQIIGFKHDFIIDNWEQAENAHHDVHANGYNPEDGTFERGRKFPGDMEWVDKDGNGIINDYDQFLLGYQIPHTVGGISNNISYRNFNIRIFLDFAIGHSIPDLTHRRHDVFSLDGLSRPSTVIFDSWQEIGDVAAGKATRPRIDYHDASQQRNVHRANYRTSFSTFRGDYLCIREVRMGYRVPETISNRIGMSNMNVFIAGQNLWYFTDYPGFVPEYEGGTNWGHGNYPISRKINIGLRVGL